MPFTATTIPATQPNRGRRGCFCTGGTVRPRSLDVRLWRPLLGAGGGASQQRQLSLSRHPSMPPTSGLTPVVLAVALESFIRGGAVGGSGGARASPLTICSVAPSPSVCITAQSLQDPVNKILEKAEKERAQKESPERKPQQPEQLISLEVENPDKKCALTEDGKGACTALGAPCRRAQCSGAISELLDLGPGETGATSAEFEGPDKDDMQLLHEILHASSLDDSDFSKEWTAVFGDEPPPEPEAASGLAEPEPGPPAASSFLPSQLLDKKMHEGQVTLPGWRGAPGSPPAVLKSAEAPKPAGQSGVTQLVKEPEKVTRDLTAWFSLFADLDPLSNPDAIGKTDKEQELLNA